MARPTPFVVAGGIGVAVFSLAAQSGAITVEEAVSAGCTTAQVEGLSLQIVAEGNCIVPGAYAELTPASNVSLGNAVLPYLEEPARDALEQALSDNASTAMQINSMLRTVAQQYLLYRWYQLSSCGISLAASPGNSNHETGLAIDIEQYDTWRTILEGVDFVWLGASDPWHFDYDGPGAVDHKGVDVLAFQRLWNRNNPGDPIGEDGAYGPQTEGRLQQSPAEGFPLGAECNPDPEPGQLELSARFATAQDIFTDGPSLGIVDLYVGSSTQVQIDARNAGLGALEAVSVTIQLPGEAMVAIDYELSSDLGTPDEHSPIEVSGNPSPDSDLDSSFELSLETIEPGETRRITLTLEAAQYTVDGLDPVMITLDAGSEEAELSADIYSDRHWEWDGERLEGWTAALDTATELTAPDDGGMLSLAADSGALTARSPTLNLALDPIEGITLRAQRTGPETAAVLYFTTDSQAEPTASHAFVLDLPTDGEPHDLALAGADLATFAGTLTGLQLALFDEPATTAAVSGTVDYLRVGSAEVPLMVVPGGNMSCLCSLPAKPADQGWSAWLWSALLAGVAARRRRRPRSGTLSLQAAAWG